MYLQILTATPTLNAKVTLVKGGSEDEIASDQIGSTPAPTGVQDRVDLGGRAGLVGCV